MHHDETIGGNEKRTKYVKTRTFYEMMGAEFFKIGGKNNFREIVGEMYWKSENRGKSRICSRWLKRSSEILADENRNIFQEKVKFWKFPTESENLSKIGGKSETGGKFIMTSGGMDASAPIQFNSIQFMDHFYSPPLSKVHYERSYVPIAVTLPLAWARP